MPDIAIRARHHTRNFGAVHALDDLSLEVPEGTLFGFLGANGAGKTTTIRLLLGLLVAGLAAGSGCLISLRSATVRQAQQILTIGFFVLLFVPIFGIQLIPRAERTRLLAQLSATSGATLALILVAVLLAVDIALLLAALARFQRARLVLD